MIGSIRGKVVRVDGLTALIELSSGLGYEVEVPANMLKHVRENEECFLFIHHVVREDAEQLYGFESYEARMLFREVTKVSGIGPKVALALLSAFDVATFVEIIRQEQTNLLVSAPGVGKKTAERIIIELRDRFNKLHLYEKAALINASVEENVLLPENTNAPKADTPSTVCAHVIEALMSLGFKESEAMSMVKKHYSKGMTQEELTEKCLSYFGQNAKF